MKKFLTVILTIAILYACNNEKKTTNEAADINKLAEKYVRLGLTIGQYDGDFVDAYYGPDSLKPITPKLDSFPKESLLKSTEELKTALNNIVTATTNDTLKNRANWIINQLTAFSRRIKIFSGESKPFDEESKELFGVAAPVHDEAYYKQLTTQLDSLLPGVGNLQDRFQALANKFVIPKDKVDTVFKTAIAEARKRTIEHYPLPKEESFILEYVTDKPWSGYNWYKGKYQSRIQINTDLPIMIDRAIDLACHEGYPGHHVYNMLLEKNLYNEKGWVEISLYPLFSPQSLIAEGSANYGIQVAFPGEEQKEFTKKVLLPLAGMDTAGADLYFSALAIRGQLNYARNEAARGIINNTLSEAEALHWLKDYALFNEEAAKKSISFIKKYRSYVINYNYGQDMVKNYIETKGGTAQNAAKRWELFGWLLSNEVATTDLLK
jgi:hypothetical protein